MNTGLITTQGLDLFSIDELSLETRSHLIRDVACSVFFGYYDYRNGYINDDFKKGVNLKEFMASLTLSKTHHKY